MGLQLIPWQAFTFLLFCSLSKFNFAYKCWPGLGGLSISKSQLLPSKFSSKSGALAIKLIISADIAR